MIRIFIGIIFTSFMIKDGIGISSVSFIDIESIFLWKNLTFNKAMLDSIIVKKFGNISMHRLDDIMIGVNVLSEEHNEYMNNLREKQDKRWKFAKDRDYNSNILPLVKGKLSSLIKTVDIIYTDVTGYSMEIRSDNKIMKHRVPVLLQNLFTITSILDEIHKLFFPTFTHIIPQFSQLILEDAERNIPDYCDQYTSAQQFVYFIYITTIITEMKGFTTLIYISSLLQHATKCTAIDYMTEIEIAERKFTARVTDYYKNIYKSMVSIPREINRCEVNPPKRNENFLELTNYHQVRLFTAKQLGHGYNLKSFICIKKCEEIDYSRLEQDMDIQIDNCHSIGLAKNLQSCPAQPGSSRTLMWWKYGNDIYGHHDECPSELKKGNGVMPYIEQCYICQCSVIPQSNKSYENAILNISVTSQISDIKNNMIVTGVQFVIYEKVLHLQIQQSKFMLNKINDNSTVWKSVDDHRTNINKSKIHSEMLSKFSGQLYLDDIMLPPKYAVTGVRFLARHNSIEGFYLQVHGTPFDLKTGKLVANDATWFIAHSDLAIKSDYERDRIEINTKNRDDPTTCKEYNYDRTTNNYIKFYHSSVSKDGGQSTVPFIDAQPVDTYPPFPLSGIGLFYRTKPECGGYITPRLFTIDISQYN